MGGEWIDLRGAVAQKVGEGHRREGMGVGMVGGVGEDHCGRYLSRMLTEIVDSIMNELSKSIPLVIRAK